MIFMDAWKAAKNALKCVLEARKGESVVIFCDVGKMDVGKAFAEGASKLGLQTRLIQLETHENVFRKEVSSQVMKILADQGVDIYINLLRGIREETPFRIELIKMETKGEARLGHCPGVTLDMLTAGALALTPEEHRKMQTFADRLIERLGQAAKVKVTSAAGTQLSLSAMGRPFFTDTKFDWKTMKWMNLPTGEVIVAPVENSLQGRLVCDMAIGGIGPLNTPLEIKIQEGKAQEVRSADAEVLKRVKTSLATDEWSDTVGEFAFGINPKARFVEGFLEAEKILGTIHIAFGNNTDMPEGKNHSKNHMDLLVSEPTVEIINENGTNFNVLSSGIF